MDLIELQPPVPKKMSQEWISATFLKALCAQAGLNISSWEWDDGLDATIGSAKAGFMGIKCRNVKFHIQLKSTIDWKIADSNKISFYLKREKYNQLASESWDPQHLVLYTLPQRRWQWVQTNPDHAVFKHCDYFYSFDRHKTLEAPAAGKTIYVHTRNRLTAGELIRMYREAATSRQLKR